MIIRPFGCFKLQILALLETLIILSLSQKPLISFSVPLVLVEVPMMFGFTGKGGFSNHSDNTSLLARKEFTGLLS